MRVRLKMRSGGVEGEQVTDYNYKVTIGLPEGNTLVVEENREDGFVWVQLHSPAPACNCSRPNGEHVPACNFKLGPSELTLDNFPLPKEES